MIFVLFSGIIKVTYIQIMMFLENLFMYFLYSCAGFPVFLTTEKSSHLQKLLLIVIKDVEMGRKYSICGIDGKYSMKF
jgi:hypothetical protein